MFNHPNKCSPKASWPQVQNSLKNNSTQSITMSSISKNNPSSNGSRKTSHDPTQTAEKSTPSSTSSMELPSLKLSRIISMNNKKISFSIKSKLLIKSKLFKMYKSLPTISMLQSFRSRVSSLKLLGTWKITKSPQTFKINLCKWLNSHLNLFKTSILKLLSGTKTKWGILWCKL